MTRKLKWRGYCKECNYQMDAYERATIQELIIHTCPLCETDNWGAKRINKDD